jgi:glutathione S-transferase
MTAPNVVLRYFEAQGRAQGLRHALLDASVQFEDVRATLATWPPHKEDGAFAGPFGSLPTLTWGADFVTETLPIASYLARRLGHYEGLDAAAIGRLESVTSCAFLDVVLRVGEIYWADALFPGVDLAKAVPRLAGHVVDKLARLGGVLPPTGWLGGDRPAVADFFAAEATEVVRVLLGPAREERLRAKHPRPFAHAARIRERPAIAQAWTNRPPNLTASPDELAAVERIHALDLSSLAL